MHGVVPGAREEQTPVGREGETVRPHPDRHALPAAVGRGVGHVDRAAAPVRPNEVFLAGPDEARAGWWPVAIVASRASVSA